MPLSKRFRALKLWFVLRNYGISGLQNMIRENVRLAAKFEAMVRFTIMIMIMINIMIMMMIMMVRFTMMMIVMMIPR